MNYEDLSRAVLKAMWPLPALNPCMVSEKDLPELKRCKEKCQKWREWAENEPTLDKQTRRAYLEWVEHCEYTNARAEKEILYGEDRKRHEEYKRRTEEGRQRANAITVIKPDFATK